MIRKCYFRKKGLNVRQCMKRLYFHLVGLAMCLGLTNCQSDTQQRYNQRNNLPDSLLTYTKWITVGDTTLPISINGEIDGHEYVDMGDEFLWAIQDLGAGNPQDRGWEFAWGEIDHKEGNCRTYKFRKNGKLTKYYLDSTRSEADYCIKLQPKDDAVTMNWGENWSMPTTYAFNSLLKLCETEPIKDKSGNHWAGYILTSSINGHKLVLPLKSIGDAYWTANLELQDNQKAKSLCLVGNNTLAITPDMREKHHAIRAIVAKEPNIQKADSTQYSAHDQLTHLEVYKRADYPGGKEALIEFLKKNLVYPPEAIKDGIQGTVIVKFVVQADGRITHAEVIRSVNPLLDEEALRVVRLMGYWIPAEIEGGAVNSYYTLPIWFRFN